MTGDVRIVEREPGGLGRTARDQEEGQEETPTNHRDGGSHHDESGAHAGPKEGFPIDLRGLEAPSAGGE